MILSQERPKRVSAQQPMSVFNQQSKTEKKKSYASLSSQVTFNGLSQQLSKMTNKQSRTATKDKVSPIIYKSVEEMAALNTAKAVLFPQNFDEGVCEDLRVEDFSSSSEEENAASYISVSIGDHEGLIRDSTTEAHIQQKRPGNQYEDAPLNSLAGALQYTPKRNTEERKDARHNEVEDDGHIMNLLSPEAPSVCNQRQSLLSSLISSPCNYDIPEGLSVSFSAEPHDSSSKQSSHRNSFSELVEF